MNTLNNFENPEILEGFRGYVQNFADYVELAQVTSNEAESWRNFDVGVTAVAIQAGSKEPVIITGANSKIDHEHAPPPVDPELDLVAVADEGGDELDALALAIQDLHSDYQIPTRPPKNCGEMAVCHKIAELATDNDLYIVGFAIAATTDETEIYKVTNLHTQTLTPCGDECVPILSNCAHTSRATLYASTGYSSDDIFQLRNIKDLLRIQKTGGEPHQDRLPYLKYNIGATALEIFDARIKNTVILGKPSRIISTIARQALTQAGRAG